MSVWVRAVPAGAGEVASTGHYQGGPPGPPCGGCARPLLLVWDLDGTDPSVGRLARDGRVRIYYCWRCAGDVAYRVIDDGIELVTVTIAEPPAPGYPDTVAVRPVALLPIPRDLADALNRWEEGDDLVREDPLLATSTIGPALPLWHGREDRACAGCTEGLAVEAAVVADPDLRPTAWPVQLVVAVCDQCGVVHVWNRAG
ncbi:MAG: hypothetical protein ABMB14_40680 [Myxococcota bacterium]